MHCTNIRFSRHAIERMFERAIRPEDVRNVVAAGKSIAEYPDDTPYPSTLLLGFVDRTPVHVVVAKDATSGTCHIVTVYVPDETLWNDDFQTRRQ